MEELAQAGVGSGQPDTGESSPGHQTVDEQPHDTDFSADIFADGPDLPNPPAWSSWSPPIGDHGELPLPSPSEVLEYPQVFEYFDQTSVELQTPRQSTSPGLLTPYGPGVQIGDAVGLLIGEAGTTASQDAALAYEGEPSRPHVHDAHEVSHEGFANDDVADTTVLEIVRPMAMNDLDSKFENDLSATDETAREVLEEVLDLVVLMNKQQQEGQDSPIAKGSPAVTGSPAVDEPPAWNLESQLKSSVNVSSQLATDQTIAPPREPETTRAARDIPVSTEQQTTELKSSAISQPVLANFANEPDTVDFSVAPARRSSPPGLHPSSQIAPCNAEQSAVDIPGSKHGDSPDPLVDEPGTAGEVFPGDNLRTNRQIMDTPEITSDADFPPARSKASPTPFIDLLTPTPTSSSRALSPARSPSRSPPPKQANFSIDLPASTLVTPPSHYEPFEPPAPEVPEWKAVDALCREARRLGLSTDEYLEFELDEFAAYSHGSHYPNEMRCLHFFTTRTGHMSYYFDGRLSVGDVSFFVRRVPIHALPIGGYTDPDIHTVKDSIWIQSAHNTKRQLYYKLGRPVKQYARFHEPFVWVADFAKHFVDFLDAKESVQEKVTIHSFTREFSGWLVRRHGFDPDFLKWGKQHPSPDFRTAVAAHTGFLYKEARGVLSYRQVESHPLWNEIMGFTHYKRERAANIPEDPTIVTKYIRDCFAKLPFGHRLATIDFSEETKALRRKIIRKRRLEMPAPVHDAVADLSVAAGDRIRQIKPGDTISTKRDEVGSGTKWQRQLAEGFLDVDRWFARVQKVNMRRGKRVFDVIWYYRPVDTLCGMMKYPWGNELFMSDHCSCDETEKISEDEVLGVHEVDFWGSSATKKEIFCRQTYIAAERKWVTLEEKHLRCEHVCEQYEDANEPKYRVGDTVLVRLKRDSGRTEPCEIVELEDCDGYITIRRLLRRREADASAPTTPPNELVWTHEIERTRRKRIFSRCYVRCFNIGSKIPTPYNRNGVGSFFYITYQLSGDGIITPLEEHPASLRQGFDPLQNLPRLRGLDLFCGGGNFGRGLEDGGAVEMQWLNDYNEHAVHTYMANVADPEHVHPFLGSIDDMQRRAMLGKFSANVPRIGDVDFISAGSPCPGFSVLTNDKTTEQQRKNQSLVAAFASFVDLYRPQYGLLENVKGIVQKGGGRDQDVFSQLICALVGLGYQTQFFFLDASSCGSPQARPRVFMVFAAPGCRLPSKPPISHSHPPGTKGLSLGWLPNGEPMAEREMPDATPFKFVSASEACDDLPRIYDAKPDTCIAYPDHRAAVGTTRDLRAQLNLIPTQPWGMNFATAWYGMDRKLAGSGVLTQAERDLFPADAGQRTVGRTLPNSMAYCRMHPNKPMNTIVTRQSPGDAKNGQQMHWREPRVITLMEARRAQGFPDHEVLLGRVTEQYKVVGNSVAREVAVALGLMFREAEYGSLLDGEEDLSNMMEVEVDGDESLDVVDEGGETSVDELAMGEMSRNGSEDLDGKTVMLGTAKALKRSHSASSSPIVVAIPALKRARRDDAEQYDATRSYSSPLRYEIDSSFADDNQGSIGDDDSIDSFNEL